MLTSDTEMTRTEIIMANNLAQCEAQELRETCSSLQAVISSLLAQAENRGENAECCGCRYLAEGATYDIEDGPYYCRLLADDADDWFGITGYVLREPGYDKHPDWCPLATEVGQALWRALDDIEREMQKTVRAWDHALKDIRVGSGFSSFWESVALTIEALTRLRGD